MDTQTVPTPIVMWEEQTAQYTNDYYAKVGKWIVGSVGMGRTGIERREVQGALQATGHQRGLGQPRDRTRC